MIIGFINPFLPRMTIGWLSKCTSKKENNWLNVDQIYIMILMVSFDYEI